MSSHRPEAILTRPAQRDYRSIQRYTLRRWGPEQTTPYMDEIDSTFDRLCETRTYDPCDLISQASLGVSRSITTSLFIGSILTTLRSCASCTSVQIQSATSDAQTSATTRGYMPIASC